MDCCREKESVFSKIRSRIFGGKQGTEVQTAVNKKVALIGNPNVGKSVIFNSLTGAYVTVSNYPGTTVEVSRGWYQKEGIRLEIIDTPGMYSMLPITEEERVTRTLLMNEKPDLVMHVVDAKNIERMLPLTLQLIEAGFPVILVLNIMDEARTLGVNIDSTALEKALGIPVVEASAALNMGMDQIKHVLEKRINNVA